MDSNNHFDTSFTKESLKKQFRLSEFLAEKIISGIAFLSIAIIFLIFAFVFKESLPLFGVKSTENIKKEIQAPNLEKPETYGGATESLTPDSYGSEPVSNDDLQPESKSEDLVPETYGSPTESLTPDSYGSEPVSHDDLVPEKQSEDIEPETYGDVVTEDLNPVASQDEINVTEEVRQVTPEGQQNTWGTFLSSAWFPVSDNPRFGLIALLIGTLKVTIIAMLFAAPIAVLAALYTSTFASKRAKEIIKPIIELLAAFPSVVIGFFALMILATFFQDIFGYETRLNAFIGGVAMALAAIPIIYTITEDALSAVPKTYTEASLALGASKWQTAFHVTLPAAVPGIFAAILLGIGRVFGETMIALMATGNAAINSANPFKSVRTFAATIGSEMAETVFGDTHYSVLFFIGSFLFIFSFGLNALAEFYVKGKLIKKIQGK